MCDSVSSSDDDESSDFFGLKGSDWGCELQDATNRAYEFLQADRALHESATNLASKECGPQPSTDHLPAKQRSHSSRCTSLKRTSQSFFVDTPKHAKLDAPQDEPEPLPPPSLNSAPRVFDASLVLSDEDCSGVEYAAKTVTTAFKHIKAHDKPIVAACWAPEPLGKLLLTASLDGHVKLWQSTTGKCLYDLPGEAGMRSACFTPGGRKILRCGWDRKAVVVDPSSNAVTFSCRLFGSPPSRVRLHPSNESIFFVGCKDSVELWDMRRDVAAGPVRTFPVCCGEVLDLLPLADGRELACSGDMVERDSCEAALSVWDVASGARLSGQLYLERYTIPCLESLSQRQTILAQTNGDYIAMFDAQRPYRLNKRRRFEGHQVSGYPVRCSVSPDGALICSGDAEGVPHIYSAVRGTTVGVVSLTGRCTPATHPDWHPSRPGLLLIGCADGYVHLCR